MAHEETTGIHVTILIENESFYKVVYQACQFSRGVGKEFYTFHRSLLPRDPMKIEIGTKSTQPHKSWVE